MRRCGGAEVRSGPRVAPWRGAYASGFHSPHVGVCIGIALQKFLRIFGSQPSMPLPVQVGLLAMSVSIWPGPKQPRTVMWREHESATNSASALRGGPRTRPAFRERASKRARAEEQRQAERRQRGFGPLRGVYVARRGRRAHARRPG